MSQSNLPSNEKHLQVFLDVLQELLKADAVSRTNFLKDNAFLVPGLTELTKLLIARMSSVGDANAVQALEGLRQQLEGVVDTSSIKEAVVPRREAPAAVMPEVTSARSEQVAETEKPEISFSTSSPVKREEPEPEEIPLNRPQVKMPRLLRLAVIEESDTTSMLVRLTDTQGQATVEAGFSLPPETQVKRAQELMYQSRLKEPPGQQPESLELLKIGQSFYQYLLPGSLKAAFEEIWEEGEPLQLHLELPAKVQRVPWEFIANEEGFLASQPDFSMSRGAKLGRRLQRLVPELAGLNLPLKLLIVVSSPLNLEPEYTLDADREVMLIRQDIRDLIERGEIELELEDQASLDQLRKTLDHFKPHLVHFTGHGFYRVERDKDDPSRSGLLLEDEERGHKLEVGARDVATVLTGRPELRAVVLSACLSALPGSEQGIGGTAEELVRAGIPAVVAMQDSVRDDSATRFARYFYPALAQGKPIVAALAEARQRMIEGGGSEGKASDWAIPVLLTAWPQLVLFNFEKQVAPRRKALFSGPSLATLNEKSESYFVGRQLEQRQVRQALSNPGYKLVLISGLGGFGKSTLAQRSLERVATQFRVIHTISCRKWSGVELAVLDLARGLAQVGDDGLLKLLEDRNQKFTTEQLAELTAKALNAGQKPSLLVLDNFEDLLDREGKEVRPVQSEVATFLEGLVLELNRGRVLITSRLNFYFTRTDRYETAIRRVSLNTLSLPESLRLMQTLPGLAKLHPAEREGLYNNGVDNPQLIEWAEALRQQAGGANWQDQSVVLHQRFSDKMLLGELYKSLSPAAQAMLRRSAVYREALPLEFLGCQQSGASTEIAALLDRKLIDSLEDEAEQDWLYRQHESVRRFGIERLKEEEGEEGLQAAHLRAAEHYEYFGDETSHDLGDYLEAKDHYLEAAQLNAAIRLVRALNSVLERRGLWRLGLALNQELNLKLSELEAKAGPKTEVAEVARADLLMQQANRLRDLGQVSESLPYYQQALALVKAAGERQAEGAILGNLGNAYSSLGQYERAIDLYQQHLAIAKEIGDRNGEGKAYGNLGNAYQSLGQYERAIQFHQQLLAIAKEIGDRNGEGKAYGNLGNAYDSLGQYEETLERRVQASLIFQQIKSPNLRQVLNGLGGLQRRLGWAEFERLLQAVCLRLEVEYPAYRTWLEQAGVFAPLQLNPYQKSLVKAFAQAGLGHPKATVEVEEWVRHNQEDKDWGKLAATVALLLKGERVKAVLLAAERGLDEVDQAIIEQTLAAIQNPALLEQLEQELKAASQNNAMSTEQRAAFEQFWGLSEEEQIRILANNDPNFASASAEQQKQKLQEILAEIRQNLGQAGTSPSAAGQAGLSSQLAQVAQLLGQALAGDARARAMIEEQILPQLEQPGGDFEKLAVVVRMMLDGERDEARLLEPEQGLDDTDRAIVQLALQVATDQAANGGNSANAAQAEAQAAARELVGLLVAAVQGNSQAQDEVRKLIEQLQDDKNTRRLGNVLERLVFEDERNAAILTKGLDENGKALVEAILAALQ